MAALKSPRFWLMVLVSAGALAVLYVMIAASVKPRSEAAPSVHAQDQSLLVGEMADFAYAFPARGAPDVPFELAGKELALADFKGKTILVNFWATWCAPCLKELPSLDALQAELGGPDFEVVAIAADPRGPERAAEFLEELKIKNLKLYADPRLRLAGAMGGGASLPLTVLYSADGQELGRLAGEADWTSKEAKRLVRSAIDGR
jgi:thiol-disulfide isomerase/thioredoxin